jgi:aminoglycoside phosphotransferase (APT) family kinase protein
VSSPARLVASAPDLPLLRLRSEAALRGIWPAARCTALTGFATGRSSLTYRCQVDDAPVTSAVLKVAVPGLMPIRNRDVLRQARILQAVSRVDGVKVPTVYAGDVGDPPTVPPLFLMEFVAGESFEPLHSSPDGAPSESSLAAREFSAVHMLAALHRVDPGDLALGDEPVVTPERELARWADVMASCELSGQQSTASERILQSLGRSIPGPLGPVVVHGDWRLGNMQCTGPTVNGVIDWEIWGLGDPRIDLGWFIMWADSHHPLAVNTTTSMPAASKLIAEYESCRGETVPEMAWFDALARYKQAAACGLLVKNARRRGDDDVRFQLMDNSMVAMLEGADSALRGV